jgi:hypothetical protein
MLVLTMVSMALGVQPLPAQAADCQFILGFKTIHDLIPDKVGACKTNEYHNPQNGDGLQETVAWHGKGGLLVWRKADNWTAYTDGSRTWVNGPNGLQERSNDERFPWEGDNKPAQPPAPTATAVPNPTAHDYFVQRSARPNQVRPGGAVTLCAKLSSPTLPPVGGLPVRIRYDGNDYQATTQLPDGNGCVTVAVTKGCDFQAWITYQGQELESPIYAAASCQVLRN